MLFFAILSRNKKIVVILFTISLLITVVYLIFEIINVSDTSALSDYQSQLIPKSAVIGVLRMTTLIPLFFVGFPTKE